MNAERQPGLPPAIDKLNAWYSYRLALLVAPTGSGKTALLRKWSRMARSGPAGSRAAEPAQVAWIDLGPQANDPERFLAGLVTALQEAAPFPAALFPAGMEEAAGGPASPGSPTPAPPTGEALLRFELGMTALANTLTHLQVELILVLDHYHHILTPAVHAAIAQLLDYPPPKVHLVIACREEPPLPLPRLRARRQMVDILPADLRPS